MSKKFKTWKNKSGKKFRICISNKRITHNDLVCIGYKWLLRSTPCGVAMKDLATWSYEQADVMGFCGNGISILIECKTSRSDFFNDRKKVFRIYPDLGMGSQRFYLCPEGLIKEHELPNGWGLLYVNDKGKVKVIKQNYKGSNLRDTAFTKNINNEYSVMYSALRRLQEYTI